MKRLTSITLAILLAASFSITAFAESYVPSREFMYNWALEEGFPKDVLDNASDHLIERIYLDNVGAEELEVFCETVTLTVPGNNTRSVSIPPSQLEFTLFGGVVARDSVIQYLNTYAWYNWQTSAIDKYTDAVVITWNPNEWVYEAGSFWSKVYDDGILRSSAEAPEASAQGGVGWYVPLANCYGIPTGEGYIKLLSKYQDKALGTGAYSQIDSQYGHATLAVTSFGISGSGGSLNLSLAPTYTSASDNIEYSPIP